MYLKNYCSLPVLEWHMVYFVVQYGVVVWGSASKGVSVSKISKLQRTLFGLMFGKKFRGLLLTTFQNTGYFDCLFNLYFECHHVLEVLHRTRP